MNPSQLKRHSPVHQSTLSFCRHLELNFLVAMVAYCISCNMINTFGISSNCVYFTVIINLSVGSFWHLMGRVSSVRAAQKASQIKDILFNIMFLSVPGNVSALSFLRHLLIYTGSCLAYFHPWTSVYGDWPFEPWSASGILPWESSSVPCLVSCSEPFLISSLPLFKINNWLCC